MSRFFYIFPSQTNPGEITRHSMACFHRALCTAINNAGDMPVFVVERGGASTSLFVESAGTDSPQFWTTTLDALGTQPEMPIDQAAGVWFDNAIDWSVTAFGEHWLRHYRGRPLPPMFGLLTSSAVAADADQSLLVWQSTMNRARLESFSGLWAQTQSILDRLELVAKRAPGVQVGHVIPRFDWNWTPHRLGPRPDQMHVDPKLPQPAWGLNWNGRFDENTGYAAFVRMIPALNRVAAERHKQFAEEGLQMPGAPASFFAVIHGDELPQDLIIPAGSIHVREPLVGTSPAGKQSQYYAGFEHYGPFENTITVATDLLAESNPELLAAAEVGCPVLAPNVGIYRENLTPVARFDAGLLAGFSVDMPDMAADRAAEDVYDALVELIQTHLVRTGSRRSYTRQHVIDTRMGSLHTILDHISETVGWPEFHA